MSAVRVPAGWTREAADFVWENWRGAFAGEPCMPTGRQGEFDDTHLAPGWRALGRPLRWWDDSADGVLDLAAELPGRIIVYIGPKMSPSVEVQGKARWEAIATPAELRACLDRLAAEAQR